MLRNRFFKKKNEYLKLSQILKLVDGTTNDKADLNSKIYDVATLQDGSKGQISFLNSGSYLEKFKESKASFCLVNEARAKKAPKHMTPIICEDPYYAYSIIVNEFYQEREVNYNSSFFANNFISKTAKIGKNCKIAPNVFIGDDVEIGDNCEISFGVSILPGCIIGNSCKINSNATISFAVIGNNCLIYSGARIGQDGFGFAHNKGINHKIIQVGLVEIGNDVEIGANSCIDRGAIANTKIGNGSKIDNLVQIGHNVEIGQGSVIAGCAAIAGSVKIGNYVQIGGNSGIAGHIKINDQSQIAGMSGIIREVKAKEIVGGIPALPIKQWHKINAKLIRSIAKKD